MHLWHPPWLRPWDYQYRVFLSRLNFEKLGDINQLVRVTVLMVVLWNGNKDLLE